MDPTASDALGGFGGCWRARQLGENGIPDGFRRRADDAAATRALAYDATMDDPMRELALARDSGDWARAAVLCEEQLGDIDQGIECWALRG